jgi:hypothetical protein
MDTIKAWLKAHSFSSKSVVTAWLAVVFLYGNNSAFHDYVMHAYTSIPHGLHSFVVGIVIPVAIFWRTTHSTKVSAEIEDGVPGVVKASASASTTDLTAPPK